jgi:hypothetical protein
MTTANNIDTQVADTVVYQVSIKLHNQLGKHRSTLGLTSFHNSSLMISIYNRMKIHAENQLISNNNPGIL